MYGLYVSPGLPTYKPTYTHISSCTVQLSQLVLRLLSSCFLVHPLCLPETRVKQHNEPSVTRRCGPL